MNAAAAAVMNELPDITLAYGISDEFRFACHKNHPKAHLELMRVGQALSWAGHVGSSKGERCNCTFDHLEIWP